MDKSIPTEDQLRRWTAQNVANWLRKEGLAEFSEHFLRMEIDGKQLARLTEAGIKQWSGIPLRKKNQLFKLINEIERRNYRITDQVAAVKPSLQPSHGNRAYHPPPDNPVIPSRPHRVPSPAPQDCDCDSDGSGDWGSDFENEPDSHDDHTPDYLDPVDHPTSGRVMHGGGNPGRRAPPIPGPDRGRRDVPQPPRSSAPNFNKPSPVGRRVPQPPGPPYNRNINDQRMPAVPPRNAPQLPDNDDLYEVPDTDAADENYETPEQDLSYRAPVPTPGYNHQSPQPRMPIPKPKTSPHTNKYRQPYQAPESDSEDYEVPDPENHRDNYIPEPEPVRTAPSRVPARPSNNIHQDGIASAKFALRPVNPQKRPQPQQPQHQPADEPPKITEVRNKLLQSGMFPNAAPSSASSSKRSSTSSEQDSGSGTFNRPRWQQPKPSENHMPSQPPVSQDDVPAHPAPTPVPEPRVIKKPLPQPVVPQPPEPEPAPRAVPLPPQESVEPDPEDIEQQPWFSSTIGRRDSEGKLIEIAQDGAFVVRPSQKGGSTNPYSLCVFYKGRCWNLHIGCRSSGKFALGTAKPGEKTFDTVFDMIEHHFENPILLQGKDGGSTCLTTYPSL